MSEFNLFSTFDPFTGEMPVTARKLLSEAAGHARKLLADVDKQHVTNVTSQFLENIVSEGMSASKLEALDQTRPRMSGLFVNVSNNAQTLDFIDTIGFTSPTTALGRYARDLNEDSFYEFMAIVVLFFISLIKHLEDSLLQKEPPADYRLIAEQLDELIFEVHEVYALLQFMKPGMDFLAIKEARNIKSKKGVRARKEKFAQLREIVITEYTTKHSDKPNAKAARDIAKHIHSVYLQDENGKALVVDPVERFTRWIGDHNRHKNG